MSDQPGLFRPEPAYSVYLNSKSAALGVPLSGTFELTTRCNFNCSMCYVHDNTRRQELTAEQWIALGREAAERGMLFLLLTGGEPFARRDFREIYPQLQSLGLLISINTNGSLLDPEMREFLAQHPPFRMNISLYGGSEETYHRLCGRDAYHTVTENIRFLHEAGIQIKLNCSITPSNVTDIPLMYDFARELDLPLQATAYMFPPVRVNGCSYGEAPARLTPEEAARAQLRCMEQYLTPEQIAAGYVPFLPPDQDCTDARAHMHCRAGRSSFWVTWDGRMVPCGMLPWQGTSILQEGFQKAWENTRDYARKAMEPAQCTSCPHRKSCPSCVASCIAETGHSDRRPDYICRMVTCLNSLMGQKKENHNDAES